MGMYREADRLNAQASALQAIERYYANLVDRKYQLEQERDYRLLEGNNAGAAAIEAQLVGIYASIEATERHAATCRGERGN